MNILKTLLFGLIFISCVSYDKKISNKMTRKWIKPTIDIPYLGPKVPHLMSPVFLDKLVIQGNGHGMLVAAHAGSGRFAWKFDAKHGIHGAVILEDNILFGTEGGLIFLLDKKGTKLWDLKLEGGIYSKPTLNNNFVYFLTSDNAVYSINLDTRKIAWKYSRNTIVSIGVLGGSPTIPYKDMLLVGFSDGYLVALHQNTGNLIWEKRLNMSDKFRDVDGMALDGDTLYVSNFDGDLLSLNAEDGSLIWKSENSGGGSSPVVTEDIVFSSSSKGNVEALRKTTGEKLWAFTLKSGFASGLLVLDDVVYFGQNKGPVIGLDIKSGEELFSFPISGTMATPSILDSTLYIISHSGNLNAIKISKPLPY